MKLHYRLIKKKNNMQLVSLVISAGILFAIVICSILFNIGYSKFVNTLSHIETEIEGKISWSNIYIGILGDLNIRDLEIYGHTLDKNTINTTQNDIATIPDNGNDNDNDNDNDNQISNSPRIEYSSLRKVSDITSLRISFNIATIFQFLFTSFEDLPEQDKQSIRLQRQKDKIPLDFIVMKSLHKVLAQDITLKVDIEQDEALLLFLEKSLFSNQILPKYSNIELKNISGEISSNIISGYVNSADVEIQLDDIVGISAVYTVSSSLYKLAQELALDISGELFSPNFFDDLSISNHVSRLALNKLMVFTPVDINITKKNEDILFNTIWENNDASLIGNYFDNNFKLLLQLDEVQIADLIDIKQSALFSDISNHKLIGEGVLEVDIGDNSLDYKIDIQSVGENKKKDIIDIDVYGDDNLITINSFLLRLKNQYIDAQGTLSFLDFGLSGIFNFYFDKPYVQVPIEGGFIFKNTPFASIGRSTKISINHVPQRPLFLEYSYIDNSIMVNLGDVAFPVIEIQQDIEKKEFLVQIQQFPLDILNDVFNITQGKRDIFDDSKIDGNVTVEYTKNNIELIEFALHGSNTKRVDDYFYVTGNYYESILYIQQGVLFSSQLKNHTFSLKSEINLETLMKDYTVNSNMISMNLEIVNPEKKSQIYNVNLSRPGKDYINIKINEAFYADVYLNNSFRYGIDSLERVVFQSTELFIPIYEVFLTGAFNSEFNKNAMIDSFELQLGIFNNALDSVDLDMSYKENIGTISNLEVQRLGRSFQGFGTVEYFPERKYIETTIIERVLLESSLATDRLIENTENQTFKVGYNFGTEDLKVNLSNVKLGIFTSEFSGNVSGEILSNFNNKSILGSIDSSTIVLNNETVQLQGNFSVENYQGIGDVNINSLLIKVDNTEISSEKIVLSNYNNFTGNFKVRTDRGLGVYEDEFIISTQGQLQENVLSIIQDSTIGMPDFDASISVYPLFNNDVEIVKQYSNSFVLRNRQKKLTITDRKGVVFLQYSFESKRIAGYIGDNNSILKFSTTGIVDLDALDIDINITHLRFGKLYNDLVSFNEVIQINSMVLQGKITLKGSMYNPVLYGYLGLTNFEGYLAFFNKDIVVNNATILISENEISMANAFVEVDKDRLLLNAQGAFNKLTIDSLQLNFLTRPNQYFKSKKIHVSTLVVEGEFQGKVAVVFDQGSTDVSGVLFFRNTILSNEKLVKRQLNIVEKNKIFTNRESYTIDVNITAYTETGVVFKWPTSNFPILSANFAPNQKLEISYAGDVEELTTVGNLHFNSGIIYYLDKKFKIKELEIISDELRGIQDPYLVSLQAETKDRFLGKTYDIYISAEADLISEMDVSITTNPYLSIDEISQLFGKNIVPVTAGTSTSTSSEGIVSTIVKLSDPISNIGVFSQFESILQRSLKVDYLSFKTKLVQNILEYSIDSNTQNSNNIDLLTNVTSDRILPYLLNQSSFEIGKYIDIIYINFAMTLDTAGLTEINPSDYYGSDIWIPLDTSLNVELPTPFFDLTWTMNPTMFGSYYKQVPLNLLTISWEKKF